MSVLRCNRCGEEYEAKPRFGTIPLICPTCEEAMESLFDLVTPEGTA